MTNARTDDISERQSRHLITVLMGNNLLESKESVEFVLPLLPKLNPSSVAELALRQSLRDQLRRDDPKRSINRFNLLGFHSRRSAIDRIASMNYVALLAVLDANEAGHSAEVIRSFIDQVHHISKESMLMLWHLVHEDSITGTYRIMRRRLCEQLPA